MPSHLIQAKSKLARNITMSFSHFHTNIIFGKDELFLINLSFVENVWAYYRWSVRYEMLGSNSVAIERKFVPIKTWVVSDIRFLLLLYIISVQETSD